MKHIKKIRAKSERAGNKMSANENTRERLAQEGKRTQPCPERNS